MHPHRDKLSREDEQAVDFVMEQKEPATQYVAPEPHMGQRVAAVENHLRLLSQMPEEAPPADLVSRVMERIADPDAPRSTAVSQQDFLQQQSRGNQA